MNLMLPDSGLLFWMTIIFLIVFFILLKFGFPMITGMVEKRSRRINDSIEAARKAEDAIAHLQQEQERIIGETKAEQARLLKEAAQERDQMILSAQDQARQEAGRILEDARKQILQEKEAVLRDIRKEVAIMSLAIAEKVVLKSLSNEAGQREFVDKMIEEIQKEEK